MIRVNTCCILSFPMTILDTMLGFGWLARKHGGIKHWTLKTHLANPSMSIIIILLLLLIIIIILILIHYIILLPVTLQMGSNGRRRSRLRPQGSPLCSSLPAWPTRKWALPRPPETATSRWRHRPHWRCRAGRSISKYQALLRTWPASGKFIFSWRENSGTSFWQYHHQNRLEKKDSTSM